MTARVRGGAGRLSAALALAGIAALAAPALAMADPGATPSGPVPSSSASSPVDGPASSAEPLTSADAADTASPEADSPTLTVDVSADKTSVHAGEMVTYTITVKNVHPTATIHDVVVRSPDVGACDKDLGDMPPHKTVTYTCKAPAPSDTFRMRVRVRGYDSGGVLISRHDNDVTIKVLPTASHSPSQSATPSHSESSSSPAAPGHNAGNGSGLAVTGTTATVLAATGAALLAGGAGLWILARRRNGADQRA